MKSFVFYTHYIKKKKLPKVLMFTGNKGSGKSTLINHFLFSIFDEKNYDRQKFFLRKISSFNENFKNNIFSNIIYINGSDYKKVKVDDIRNLKTKIYKSSILNKERFIIFDDIDLFNTNSLNALLKIIEEPGSQNYFFLINNKSKQLLETIRSRALEIKIILKETQRLGIIEKLIDFYRVDMILDTQKAQLTPGNFLKFNHIFHEYDISLNGQFIENLSQLLNLYKKNKDILFIDMVYFIADLYLRDLKSKNIIKNDKIYEFKNFIFDNLNNFLLYNINQTALINNINNKLNHE